MARFERNMTLKEVANRCGMSATHISEVERGKTSPTIGALQRIAAALGEKTSHFVRQDDLPRVHLIRKHDRRAYYLTDRDKNPMAIEVISSGIPNGHMQVFTKSTPPGERSEGTALVAEAVFLCVSGMTRITAFDESHVLREGDTLQVRLDQGYTAENIGEEENEVMLIVSAPVLMPL